MKRFSLLVFPGVILLGATLLGQTMKAQTTGTHQVYLLPMVGGLDQYLADWITRGKIAQIVTDPKAADLVMTDHLGEAFEQKLMEIHPPEVKKVEEKKSDDKKDDKTEKKIETAGVSLNEHNAFRSSVARGTLFLVDVKSRQVVWSDHEKPPVASDASLNREAERVAKKLQAAFSR